jgi:phenylacetate-CoA ligase
VDLYGPLFNRLLYPAWESLLRERPTLTRLDYLERTQWRSLDELTAIQTGAVRRLVRHCYDHVPFYRRHMDAAGLAPGDVRTPEDLVGVPVITRQSARGAPEDRRSAVGPRPIVTKTTGGTTGEPLVIGYELDSEHWRQAIKLRGYAWAGHAVGEPTLHYWGFPMRAPPPFASRAKVRLDRAIKRETYVNCTLRGDDELAKVVDVIRRDKPRFLVCYTQAGGDLARYVNERGLRTWGDIAVLCGAERLFDRDRRELSAAFGPQVFETYGCREVMLIAAECEAHDGLHESMENVLVELVVNDDGKMRHAREGEAGEVVLTDLHNFSMPFLRYANGDLAVAGSSARCACGRGLRRIRAIDGRTTDTLRDARGARVSGMVFNLIFSTLAATVRQFQAVQHADGSITLRVVPQGTLDAAAMAHIRRCCDKYLPRVAVTVEPVAEIPLSKSGKRQPVVVEH